MFGEMREAAEFPGIGTGACTDGYGAGCCFGFVVVYEEACNAVWEG